MAVLFLTMGKKYRTIWQNARTEQIIERSRFITSISRISSREEAEAFIASIKAEFKGATHNVPAFIAGSGGEIMMATDSGEPSGTAGAPILNVLKGAGLTDVCCVVTRYFGGVKLGTGGLVRAYSGSAKICLEKAGTAWVEYRPSAEVKTGYASFARLKSMLPDGMEVSDIRYTDTVTFRMTSAEKCLEEAEGIIRDITRGDVLFTDEGMVKTLIKADGETGQGA